MQGPPGGLAPGSQPNEFGRPLPKTFQQNTIVPNKGMLVEDDDDSAGDDDDAFNLEGAAARRQTNKSAKSINMAQEKMVAELEKQVADLQSKASALEGTIQDKDDELRKLKDAEGTRDSVSEVYDNLNLFLTLGRTTRQNAPNGTSSDTRCKTR